MEHLLFQPSCDSHWADSVEAYDREQDKSHQAHNDNKRSPKTWLGDKILWWTSG